MLDRVYYISNKEVVLVFVYRAAVVLSCNRGNVMKLLDEFLAPLNSECVTLSDYIDMMKASEEDTQVINMEEVI